MHADIQQIALEHEERGQHEGDVARRRPAMPPEPQHQPDHRRAHDHDHGVLHGAVIGAAHPGPPRPATPLRDDAGEALVLARFRAEGLHDRVAADRVGQRAAELRVPLVGKARRRRDIEKRQRHRHRDIDDRADRDDDAHHRPVGPEQHRRADQHHDRGQQRQDHCVVELVQRPHAARDLAHRRAGEAVCLPVRRKTLNFVECLRCNVGHDRQSQADDAGERDVPRDHHADAERQHGREGLHSEAQRRFAGIGGGCDRVHDAAGIERQQHMCERFQKHRGHDERRDEFLAPPVAEGEGEDARERAGQPAAGRARLSVDRHGVFRSRPRDRPRIGKAENGARRPEWARQRAAKKSEFRWGVGKRVRSGTGPGTAARPAYRPETSGGKSGTTVICVDAMQTSLARVDRSENIQTKLRLGNRRSVDAGGRVQKATAAIMDRGRRFAKS